IKPISSIKKEGRSLSDRPKVGMESPGPEPAGGAELSRGRLVDLSLPSALRRLGLPVLIEQLLALLVGFVDTYLTGHFLSDGHLAAAGMAAYLLWGVSSLFATLSIGATARMAQLIGAQQWDDARRTTQQVLGVALLSGVGIALFGAIYLEPLVRLLGLQGVASIAAKQYIAMMLWVLPAMAILQVGNALLRGAGDTSTGLWIYSGVNLINASLSYLLVAGVPGFPNLGWHGVVLGTAIGYLLGGLAIAGLLIKGWRGLRWNPLAVDQDGSPIRKVLAIGIPGGIDMMLTVGCQLWFVALINRLGTLASASHGLAIRIEAIAYLPCQAFSIATMTLVGQLLGAGQIDRAQRTTWRILVGAMAMMAFVSLMFLLFSDPLAGALVGPGHPQTQQISAGLLRTVAWGLPWLAVIQVLSAAMRGAGKTKIPLWISLFSFLIVRIPLTYLIATDATGPFVGPAWLHPFQGQGVQGAWYAMLADLTVRAILFAIAFRLITLHQADPPSPLPSDH
ncbi:MAG: MATE family efflux transporter, partial [Pirellulaceae bacterium]